MTYAALGEDEIKAWDKEYGDLTEDLANEHDDAAKAKITAKMQSIAVEAEAHLNQAGRTIGAYYKQHKTKVDNWLKLSDTAIANARKAADKYKKDPSRGVPTQIHQAVADMTLWEKAIADDAQDFGAAWSRYRGEPVKKIPVKYRQTFMTTRSKVMEDQKAVSTIRTKIMGYIAEAQALDKVVAKATMKAGIKAGTGVQRPIAEAQGDARELATQMAEELNLLRAPRGLQTQPAAITNAMEFLVADSKNKAFVKNTDNVTLFTGRQKTLESGIMLMRTRVASMEKILATKTKGFRKNEISDQTVKDEVQKAQKSLKDAQTDLKTSEGEVKKGLAAVDTIKKRWAKK